MLTKNLKHLRAVTGLTQQGLAQKIGFSQQAIARWETGKATPDPDTLIKLAAVFNVSVDELLGSSKPKETYYLNPETAKMAQELHDNPKYRILFDASKKLPPEALQEVINFIDFQLSKEGVKDD